MVSWPLRFASKACKNDELIIYSSRTVPLAPRVSWNCGLTIRSSMIVAGANVSPEPIARPCVPISEFRTPSRVGSAVGGLISFDLTLDYSSSALVPVIGGLPFLPAYLTKLVITGVLKLDLITFSSCMTA